MEIKIKKGKHYPFPYFFLGFPIWVRKNKITSKSADFMFTDSCMFNLKDEDQRDVNKLFGFSIGHHQKGTSFRFGWRPDLEMERIEIVGYEYHNGIRQKTMPITYVKCNVWCKYTVLYDSKKGISTYKINNTVLKNNVKLNKKYGLGYSLGIYFGGNEKAPQDIIIYKL